MTSYWFQSDIMGMPFCQDLLCHLTYNLRGAWHIVYAMLLSSYKWDVWKSYNGKVEIIGNKLMGILVHTAFLYHLPIVLIWLKYCWKGYKIASHPSIICIGFLKYIVKWWACKFLICTLISLQQHIWVVPFSYNEPLSPTAPMASKVYENLYLYPTNNIIMFICWYFLPVHPSHDFCESEAILRFFGSFEISAPND